jgi:hypothetical protein
MAALESVALIFVVFLALILILLAIGLCVFSYWGLWKMYKKAGQDGWKVLIPYYNNWVLMVDIAGLHMGYFIALIVLSLVSVVVGFIPGLFVGLGIELGAINYLFSILSWIVSIASILIDVAMMYNLSKKFNKGIGWVVLSMFFSFITLPLLGFLKSEKYEDVKVSKNSLYASLFK